MAWVKLDDQFPMNPKVQQAGPHGIALHVTAMCWVAGQLTDGHIPTWVLGRLAGLAGVNPHTVDVLVKAGLWDVVAGGWHIHDWLDWNPPAEKVKAERAAARERMANGRRSSPEVRPNGRRSSASPSPSPVVPTEQRAAHSARSPNPQVNPQVNPGPDLSKLAAYNRPDLAPGCPECAGFGVVFEGRTEQPCPLCTSPEATP